MKDYSFDDITSFSDDELDSFYADMLDDLSVFEE